MALWPTPSSRTAQAREPQHYKPFPELPPGPLATLALWLEATRIHPGSALEWQCSEEWEILPRRVNDSMWFWIERGHGWGRVGLEGERQPFRIRSGDLVLIAQGEEHAIRQDRGVAMRLFAVHFHAQVFEGVNLLDLLGFPAHLPGTPPAPFGEVSRRLAREWALKAPGWRASMAAEILTLLLYVVRHHGQNFRAPGAGQAHALLPRLLPAFEHLDRNLHDPGLRVGDLARRLFLSEVQFRKLFRRVTGRSPVRFMQRRRIERACALLHGSELSVEQIAEACGFRDVPFFYRVFRQWAKSTPASFRKAEGL